MDSCSSEHEMVSLPIECTPSHLGERGTPKCGKALVNLGITHYSVVKLLEAQKTVQSGDYENEVAKFLESHVVDQ